MRRKIPIFYSAILLTGVNLLLRLVGTSFQVYLSGRIGASGIGLVQLVLSVGSLSMTAGMAGVRTATMYLCAEELGKKRPQNIRWVLSGCFLYSILISATISLGLYIFAPVIAQFWIGHVQTVSAIRLYAAFLPMVCLCGCMTGYFTAANRIGTLAAVEVAEQALSMTFTLSLLHFWAGEDPYKACMAVVCGSSVSACFTFLCLLFLRLREKAPAGPRLPVRRRLLDIAVPLALADDLKAGLSTAENLMVPKRLALYGAIASPLAAFGTVCGMVFPVMMFPAAILFGLAELLIPELARCAASGSSVRIRYLTGRSLRLSMLYGCFIGGLLFLLADPLCLSLYQSQQAGQYLRLYALLVPMLYCDLITDAMTKGLGKQKICMQYNILTAAMDILLLYLLLPKYGMQGYFFSFLITHLINFILSLRLLLKSAGSCISFCVTVLTLTAVIFAVWAASSLYSVVLQVGVYLLLLVSLLFLFNVLGKEDLVWLKGLLLRT